MGTVWTAQRETKGAWVGQIKRKLYMKDEESSVPPTMDTFQKPSSSVCAVHSSLIQSIGIDLLAPWAAAYPQFCRRYCRRRRWHQRVGRHKPRLRPADLWSNISARGNVSCTAHDRDKPIPRPGHLEAGRPASPLRPLPRSPKGCGDYKIQIGTTSCGVATLRGWWLFTMPTTPGC